MRFPKLILPVSPVDEEPLESICINREWIPVVLSVIERLEFATAWAADTDMDAAKVQVHTLAYLLVNALEGCGLQENCQTYSPTSSRITWFPESPFAPGEDVPAGYPFHPWTVVTNSIISTIISDFGLGYKVGDVFTDLLHFPTFTGWDDMFEDYLNFPHFRVNDLVGTGTVKLHLLNIPFGGKALVAVDGVVHLLNPFANQIIELNKEISVPPETQVPLVIEVEIDTPGEHYIDVVFLPTVNPSLVFLSFGGGVRAIEICGFGVEGCPEMTEPCCDETNDLLSQMLKILQNGFEIFPREGNKLPPDIGGGDCAPAFFDHDTDETDEAVLLQRQRALCITAERYVKGILIAGLVDMGAPSVLIDYIESQLPLTLPPSFTKLQVVYPSIFSGLAAFFAALTGGAELPLIACAMVIALEGETNNTFANFRTSVDAALLTSLIVPLAGMVQASNGLAKNYQLFNLALHDANEEDLSGYSCPCGIETPPAYCEEPLELFVSDDYGGSTGTTITLVAPNVYHIVQNTPAGGGIHYAAIEESNGRCLRFEMPPVEYAYQAATIYNTKGCCDDADQSAVVGDFIGGLYKSVQWAPAGTDPIDTHIQITCEDCCPPLELEDYAGTGCQIQYMGDCIWKFTQSSPDENDRTYMSFRSIDLACLVVENSDRAEYPTQGVGGNTIVTDCDGVTGAEFVGGFTPSSLRAVTWHGANPTYFKIRPE